MFKKQSSFFICLWLLCALTINAASVDDEAAYLLNVGKKKEAKTLYRSYLNSNLGNPLYAQHLINAASIEDNVTLSINLINSYVNKVTSPQGRELVYTELATMHELSGQMAEAAINYQKAFEFSRPTNFNLMIHSAYLKLELGETQSALDSVVELYKQELDAELKNRTLQLMFIIYAREKAIITGNRLIEKELSFINQSANAKLLSALYRFYDSSNQKEKANLTKAMLSRRFPHSMEAMMVNDKILRYPSPVNLW